MDESGRAQRATQGRARQQRASLLPQLGCRAPVAACAWAHWVVPPHVADLNVPLRVKIVGLEGREICGKPVAEKCGGSAVAGHASKHGERSGPSIWGELWCCPWFVPITRAPCRLGRNVPGVVQRESAEPARAHIASAAHGAPCVSIWAVLGRSVWRSKARARKVERVAVVARHAGTA